MFFLEELVSVLLGIAVFAIIILTPVYCLIKGIRYLYLAVKDKDNRKYNLKNGLIFVALFIGFVVWYRIMLINLENAIVASM